MNHTTDHDRLFLYVECFFRRHEKTEWPTVRRAAKSLGWTHVRVQDAVEGDPDARLFTSSYNTAPPQPLGDHFVESYG